MVATQIVDQVLAALRGTDFANALNMPFQITAGTFDDIRPFLELGEKIGMLHAGLANSPVQLVEVEVKGDEVAHLVRAIAAAILKGYLHDKVDVPMNYINAPVLAEQHGIAITQARGINSLDYPNLITCRVSWEGGHRTLAGVLFGGSEPRIVQVDRYRLEAKPDGLVLLLLNQDVPGVIGQVGTLLAEYKVNIAEWRLGRNEPGGEALSFINLDSEPPPAVSGAPRRRQRRHRRKTRFAVNSLNQKQKGSAYCCKRSLNSTPGGTRTPNRLVRSQILYPLSYGRLNLRDLPR